MPEEIADRKKLEANYSVYIKIAEREYLGKNFKSALKSFKNACEVAHKLNNVENVIKTLDTQASCLEQMGNYEEAFDIASKLIYSHKTSPVGYLRMGKLLRLKKELGEAEKFYRIGLKKSNSKDPLYGILEKQLKTIQNLTSSSVKIAEDAKEQVYGKGHLLSIPDDILNQICSNFSNRNILKNFAMTCNSANSIVMRGLFTGSFGLTSLRALKSSQLYSKLLKEYELLQKFNQNSIFSVNSEASTLLFLMHLKKNMVNLMRKSPRINNLILGPMRSETVSIFEECIQRGLSPKRLKLDVLKSTKTIEMNSLTELVLGSEDCNLNVPNLESLTILTAPEGIRTFSNCKRLKCLIYPTESDFNSFNSEKIVMANLKYEQSVTMRPRPIKFLSLNGNSNNYFPFIDLTQYSYESIKVLHLNNITLNADEELIKSSCWNNLKCLRLNKLMLKIPPKDLTAILKKCPSNLSILEIVSVPLSGLNDFNSNENGMWLIDAIYKHFPNLEHLILGDLTLGPAAVNLLIKKLVTKQIKLKIFGFIQIQSLMGYNFEQLYTTFTINYPNSNLLINNKNYQEYCEEYNLFKTGKPFITLTK